MLCLSELDDQADSQHVLAGIAWVACGVLAGARLLVNQVVDTGEALARDAVRLLTVACAAAKPLPRGGGYLNRSDAARVVGADCDCHGLYSSLPIGVPELYTNSTVRVK